MSLVLSFPRLPTHGGTCTATTHAPACDQLGSWGGCRHSSDCNLGVCPGGKAPLSVEREERSSPGPTRVMGRGGLGGLVTLIPSPHPQPLGSDGPGLGEGDKMVPTPVHTGPSSSLPPELPLTLPVTLLCHLAGHGKEQTTGSPEGRDRSRFSK